MFTLFFLLLLICIEVILIVRNPRSSNTAVKPPWFTITDSLNFSWNGDKASIPLSELPPSAGVTLVTPAYGIAPFLVSAEDWSLYEDSVIGSYVDVASGSAEPNMPGQSRDDMLHGQTFLAAKRQAAQFDNNAREKLSHTMSLFCQSVAEMQPVSTTAATQLLSNSTLGDTEARYADLYDIFAEIAADKTLFVADITSLDSAAAQSLLDERREDRRAARAVSLEIYGE